MMNEYVRMWKLVLFDVLNSWQPRMKVLYIGVKEEGSNNTRSQDPQDRGKAVLGTNTLQSPASSFRIKMS
ncbi:hypothetical protein Hdeb2414_s0008g00290581 [Helianthus debilis subsp. tardiflorus]